MTRRLQKQTSTKAFWLTMLATAAAHIGVFLFIACISRHAVFMGLAYLCQSYFSFLGGSLFVYVPLLAAATTTTSSSSSVCHYDADNDEQPASPKK